MIAAKALLEMSNEETSSYSHLLVFLLNIHYVCNSGTLLQIEKAIIPRKQLYLSLIPLAIAQEILQKTNDLQTVLSS